MMRGSSFHNLLTSLTILLSLSIFADPAIAKKVSAGRLGLRYQIVSSDLELIHLEGTQRAD